MGCAKDIVESCGVARFLFSDFPLGNSCGKPHDQGSQAETLALALGLFDSARGPRTTLISPQRWADCDDWKSDFMNVGVLSKQELERRKRDFARQKAVAREIKHSA